MASKNNQDYIPLNVNVSLSHNYTQLIINDELVPDVNFPAVYGHNPGGDANTEILKDVMPVDRPIERWGVLNKLNETQYTEESWSSIGIPLYSYRALIIDRNSGLVLENISSKANSLFYDLSKIQEEINYKTLPIELKNYQGRQDVALLFLWRSQRTIYERLSVGGYIFGPDGDLKDFLVSCGSVNLPKVPFEYEQPNYFNTINYADLYILLGIPGIPGNGQEAFNVLPKGIDTENALKGIFNKPPAVMLATSI